MAPRPLKRTFPPYKNSLYSIELVGCLVFPNKDLMDPFFINYRIGIFSPCMSSNGSLCILSMFFFKQSDCFFFHKLECRLIFVDNKIVGCKDYLVYLLCEIFRILHIKQTRAIKLVNWAVYVICI